MAPIPLLDAFGRLCASLDTDVAAWSHAHLSPLLQNLFLALSALAAPPCVTTLWLAAALILVLRRRWHVLLTLALIVPGGTLLGELLKILIQRPRPFSDGPEGPWGGYSFPSSHMVAATVLYVSLTLIHLPIFKKPRHRFVLLALCAALVLGVGGSRIALGAHHVTDVLGGLALGLLWIALCAGAVRALRNRRAPAAAPADVPESPV